MCRPAGGSARPDGARAGIGESIEPAGVDALRWWPCVTAGGGQMMRLGAANTREAAGRVPRPRTSFVGRERELGSARRLLDGTRLLTLTGPGGSGKTRLGIALAVRIEAEFGDGVHF